MNKTLDLSHSPRISDVMNIALPMVVSQASETVNIFVDRLFLSNLGKLYLAGSLSGGITAFTLMSLFIGIAGYINAIVAQNDGAGRKKNCARATAQGLYLSLLSWPILILCIPLIQLFLNWIIDNPQMNQIASTYFRILIYGSVFNISRFALGGFFIGLGKTRIVMLANLVGMLVNIPLNWILVFGKFGLPPLGVVGAGLGTVGGMVVINIILLAAYLSPRYRREYHTGTEYRFHRPLACTLLEFGGPTGIEIFLNVAAFNLFIQLMQSFDPDVAAAITITINYDLVAFIPLLGLNFAASALVGRYMGAKQIKNAQRATLLTYLLGLSYSCVIILSFVFGADILVQVFSRNLENGSVTVLPLARTMLRLAALYTFADCTQLIFSGALRGAGDTKFPMRISVVLHWLFAGLAWYLIKQVEIKPITGWFLFIAFVLLLSIVIFWRYATGIWQRMSLVREE